MQTYYANRSQPPLLGMMLDLVTDWKLDRSFCFDALVALEAEHAYWATEPKGIKVCHDGRVYNLSRYHAAWQCPRPESYKCASVTSHCQESRNAIR
jgi:neutral trehalase